MSNLKGRFPGRGEEGAFEGGSQGAGCREFMEDLGITKVMGSDSIKVERHQQTFKII